MQRDVPPAALEYRKNQEMMLPGALEYHKNREMIPPGALEYRKNREMMLPAALEYRKNWRDDACKRPARDTGCENLFAWLDFVFLEGCSETTFSN